MLSGYLNELKFTLRDRFLGNLVLRPSLPTIPNPRLPYDESSFYKLLLQKAFDSSQVDRFDHVIDIGCRNWSYVETLAAFFPTATLTGTEVDGKRRYWNLYRRIDFAQAYATKLKKAGRNVQVFAQDFRDLKLNHYSGNILYCFLYPFVSENPCLKWGLPSRFADFSLLLEHSQKLEQHQLKKATWLSIHQGEWEANEAREIYKKRGLQMREIPVKADQWASFWPSPYDSWIFINKFN